MSPTLDSLNRGLPRIVLLVLVGLVNMLVSFLPELLDLTGGIMPTLAPICYGAGLVFLGLAGGDFALRILQPKVDPQRAALTAIRNGDVGSGLVYLGRCILAAAVLLLFVTASRAAEPPAAALQYLYTLKIEQLQWWPAHPLPSALGAQVEQETGPCPGRSCWNPRAELRTRREQGIGLGQLTRTWRADGTQRFDAMAEIVQSFPAELKGLSWENRYDAALQLRALVLKDLQGYRLVLGSATDTDRLAMSFAAYNGGSGGLASDRRACAATARCDKGVWFENVERTSLKAKAALPGYGMSFFCVNRLYVKNVMVVRRVRYRGLES